MVVKVIRVVARELLLCGCYAFEGGFMHFLGCFGSLP